MTYWILIVTYLVGTDVAVLDSYEECAYAQNIIINDHAYIPNSTLRSAVCLQISTE